jgi:hypothetical protein
MRTRRAYTPEGAPYDPACRPDRDVSNGNEQSWLALSGQVSAVNKWNLCRLPVVGWRKRRRNSCCRDLRQVFEIGAIRRASVKARMRALAVVKVQIPADRSAELSPNLGDGLRDQAAAV